MVPRVSPAEPEWSAMAIKLCDMIDTLLSQHAQDQIRNGNVTGRTASDVNLSAIATTLGRELAKASIFELAAPLDPNDADAILAERSRRAVIGMNMVAEFMPVVMREFCRRVAVPAG